MSTTADRKVKILLVEDDKELADFDKILSELKEKFGSSITPLQLPIGKESDFCGIVDLIKMEEVRFDSGTGKNNKKSLQRALAYRG